MVTQQSTNATAIWLGHNWMQLFLASWVSRNNPPDTPVSQLKPKNVEAVGGFYADGLVDAAGFDPVDGAVAV
ncbi:hypothetical protein MW887_007252 [Aspergillus wentii]|nr:hypothetical protein MW887_007252 [Aspergillus wentii]